MTHPHSGGPKPISGFKAGMMARDQIPQVREPMFEIMDNKELSVPEQVKRCFGLLPYGANLIYYWPHTADGQFISGTSAELTQMSAIVARRGRDVKDAGKHTALVNVSSFVQSKKTGHIHIGEAGWTEEPENAGLFWGAGRKFDLFETNPRERDFFKEKEVPGIMSALHILFNHLVNDSLIVVDNSAASADLPTLEIPASRFGNMKLWGNSTAFKEDLVAVCQMQNWGIHGVSDMFAPCAGVVRATEDGIAFTGKDGTKKFFATIGVQQEIESTINQVFSANDYMLDVVPKFPLNRDITVRADENLWKPARLPDAIRNDMIPDKEALATELMNTSSDAFEARRIYKGFAYWVALTRSSVSDGTRHLDGRYISGVTIPRLRIDRTPLVFLAYGLEFSLANKPSRFVAGSELTETEYKKVEDIWRSKELVLLDLNNKSLGTYFRRRGEQLDKLEASGRVIVREKPQHKPQVSSRRPQAKVASIPAEPIDTNLLMPSSAPQEPVNTVIVPVEVVQPPVEVVLQISASVVPVPSEMPAPEPDVPVTPTPEAPAPEPISAPHVPPEGSAVPPSGELAALDAAVIQPSVPEVQTVEVKKNKRNRGAKAKKPEPVEVVSLYTGRGDGQVRLPETPAPVGRAGEPKLPCFLSIS